jgi:hypothetical protein
MFLAKTVTDSLAIWVPYKITGFSKPIVLSTGNGVTDFVTLDQGQIAIVQKTSLNRNIYQYEKPTLVTGNMTFHVASDALIAIREIIQAQSNKMLGISGICSILVIGSATYTQYKNFVWTSQFTGASLGKVSSDVPMSFSSAPPTQISLGAILSIGTSLSGLGIL